MLDSNNANNSSDDIRDEDKPRESRNTVGKAAVIVCAAIIAAAAGAAAMAIKLTDDTAEPRIHYDSTSSAPPAEESTVPAAMTGTSAITGSDKADTELTVTSASYVFPADINTADTDCLASVRGISLAVAEDIVKYREKQGVIHSLDELLDVYGVGERTLSVIKEYFYVSEADYQPVTTTSKITTTAPPKVTTKKQTTIKTTTSRASTTTVTTPAPEMKPVDINKASAEEISEALLIDPELAEKIVELRQKIGKFVNDLELLYVDGFSEKMLVDRREYIIL